MKLTEKTTKIIRFVALGVAIISVLLICFFIFFKKPKTDGDSSLTQDMQIAIDTDVTQEQIDNLPEGASKEFAALYAINDEVAGWLTIPNAGVDTVIVQSPEGTRPDKDKYLHGTNWQGNYYYYGAVYADARSTFKRTLNPTNTIIYGHNMYPIDDSLFFTNLINYEKFDFYKQCPIIQFRTLYQKADYKIFAIMYCNTSEDDGEVFNYIANRFVNITRQEVFDEYYNSIMERNLITNDVDVKFGDELITLSTCENRFLKNSRLVIFGRKVRDGESSEVDVSKASINTNVRMPEAWYTKGYGSLMK